jgi:hypothetical protein
VRLPADYVREFVDLGCAETSQADQGRDVDRSLLYVDGPAGASGIYVPMTRGRESNEAFVVVRGEETPADVIAECLSRTWIDRPVVAVRAELRPSAPQSDVDDGGALPEPVLESATLRRLLERDTEIEHALTQAPTAVGMARRRVVSLAQERTSLVQSVHEMEARLATARRAVDDLDRPLVRRRHRVELNGARQQVEWLPRSILRGRRDLTYLDRVRRDAMQQLRRAEEIDRRRPQLAAERATIRAQLDRDAQVRARGVDKRPPAHLLEHLGPPPQGAAAQLWVDAAGRIAQHQAAFELPDTTMLGDPPRPMGDFAYATSHGAAVKAIERLDRALGRQAAIRPPQRSLGISL